MSRPSAGFFSNHSPSWSLTTFCTNDFASVLPSLVLVWPSNCGSASLTETIAVRPSRTSSPDSRSSFFLIRPHSSAQLLTVVVSAARKPSSWVPPSWVLIVLAKVCTDSVKLVFHCIATSRLMPDVVVGRLERDDAAVDRVLGRVEVLDVVDEPVVVEEPALDAAGVVAAGCRRRRRRPTRRWSGRRPPRRCPPARSGRSSRTTISRPLLRKAISRKPAGDRLERVVDRLEDRRSAAHQVMVVPVSSVASCRSRSASGTPKRERLGPAVAVVLDLDDQLLAQRVDDGRCRRRADRRRPCSRRRRTCRRRAAR